jgi:hypothetical protein
VRSKRLWDSKGLTQWRQSAYYPQKGRNWITRREDLILRYDNQVLLLELKRLQPRGIVIPGREGDFEKVDFPSVLKAFKVSLPSESETLRDLELSDYVQKVLNLPQGARVRDLEKKAEGQVRGYIGSLHEKIPPSSQFEPSPWFKLDGLFLSKRYYKLMITPDTFHL